MGLGLVKLGRYWSPWPNAEGIFSPAMALAGAILELPLFGLMPWVFGFVGAICGSGSSSPARCSISVPFTSSLPARCDYRIPGEMPALGLGGSADGRRSRNGLRPWLVAA